MEGCNLRPSGNICSRVFLRGFLTLIRHSQGHFSSSSPVKILPYQFVLPYAFLIELLSRGQSTSLTAGKT